MYYHLKTQVKKPMRRTVLSKKSRDERSRHKKYGMELTALPSAKIVDVTMAISFFSDKSIVWNTSISGTPYFLHASWNLEKWSDVSVSFTN